MSQDLNGNNALHLAYKNLIFKEFEEELKNHPGLIEKLKNVRNERGFLPDEMMHTSLTDDKEPDYVLVVKKDRSAVIRE